MNLPAIRLAQLIRKLEWSAEGEWSASVTPEECKLLLRQLTKPKECKCRGSAMEKRTTPNGEFVD